MPSTRPANFEPDYIEAELMPEGTQRALPPASIELRAPADVSDRADTRWRHEHPAKRGRPPESDEDTDAVAGSVFEALREGLVPRELAEDLQCTPERAKRLVSRAKDRMTERIDEYVDVHMVAAKVAAIKGDAKPAQWFLENFATRDGERVIEPPAKEAPAVMPTFNVGFVLGGMPQQATKQLPPGKS
jgi:hypothetical protein